MITLKIKAENSLIPTVVSIHTFPCRIGRSLKNNIILEDPSISKEHAILNFDNQGPYLMDLGSTNGIFDQDNAKQEKIYISHATCFRIGDLRCEAFLDLNDESLEKTRFIHLPAYNLSKQHFRFNKNFIIFFSLFFLLSLTSKYISAPIDKKTFGLLLLEVVLGIGVLYALAGLISLVSKVHVKQYRYNTYLIFFLKWAVYFSVLKLYPFFSFSLITNELFWKYFNITINFGFIFLFLYQFFILFLTKINQHKALVYAFLFTLGLASPFAIKKYFIQSDDDLFQLNGILAYPLKSFTSKEYPSQLLYAKLNKSIKELAELKKEQIEEIKRAQ